MCELVQTWDLDRFSCLRGGAASGDLFSAMNSFPQIVLTLVLEWLYSKLAQDYLKNPLIQAPQFLQDTSTMSGLH